MRLTNIEKFLVARFCYNIGYDYISDQEYDLLYKNLPKYHPQRYMNYEELKIEDVEKYLKMDNIFEKVKNHIENTTPSQTPATTESTLNEYMSLFSSNESMMMVNDYDTVYSKYLPQIFDITRGQGKQEAELFQTFKMDGWNITVYYRTGTDGNIVYAHTRGRAASAAVTDCTAIMRYLTPNIKNELDAIKEDTIFKISGELVLKREGLEKLRQAYPEKSFSNVRNSISAFVHSSINIDAFHDLVDFYAYSITNSRTHTSPYPRVDQCYALLQYLGFNVPPYLPIKLDINQDPKPVMEQAYKIFEDNYVNQFSSLYECDGLVLQPTDMTLNEHIQQVVQGSFGEGLLAIKARFWAEKKYKGTVGRIEYPKARVSRSVMAILDPPVETELGQKVTRVPLINLQRAVIENDVHVGDTIEFIYHSNQLPMFTRNISQLQRKGVETSS